MVMAACVEEGRQLFMQHREDLNAEQRHMIVPYGFKVKLDEIRISLEKKEKSGRFKILARRAAPPARRRPPRDIGRPPLARRLREGRRGPQDQVRLNLG